jgi:anti-anti-sigma factor
VVDFERIMDEQIRDDRRRFVIDMSRLNYTSSAGIGALMRLMHDLCVRNGDLVLLGPSEKVLEVLELLDFTRIFKLARSPEEALILLQQGL